MSSLQMAWEWNMIRLRPYAPDPHQRISELRGFLGLASFHCRHCQSFSRLAVPLMDMLKKDELFEWTTESNKAFEALKDALSSASLLTVPDPNLDYELAVHRRLWLCYCQPSREACTCTLCRLHSGQPGGAQPGFASYALPRYRASTRRSSCKQYPQR